MFTKHQHSRRRGYGAGRCVGVTAAVLLCAALGACTAASSPGASTAPGVVATPLPAGDVGLDGGTYLFDGFSVPVEVTVAEGWTWINDRVLRKDVGDTEGVFVWFGHATHVPADACSWPGTLAEIGPAIADFTDALAAQTSTTMTAPGQITKDDYSGVEFDYSVEGVAGLEDCSSAKICIHSEGPSCTRWYNSSVAQRETYRVLDLDGERAIITFGEFDDKTRPALIEEAMEVFESITFVSE